MAKNVLIKPIISEKSEKLSATVGHFCFIVNKKSNKIEIKKAVEAMYPEVKVERVNTAVMPAKSKSRNTRAGVLKGRISSYKKAYVTLAEGSDIDFFGEV